MSYSNVKDIKDIAFLVSAAFTAYQAFIYIGELEKKYALKEKRRIQELKRRRADDADSTSSDDEFENKPSSLNSTDAAGKPDQQQVVPSPHVGHSVEKIMITNPRTIARKKFRSGLSNGEFVDSVASTFSDKQFKKHFRVSRKTMGKLHDLFISSTEYKNIFKLGEKTRIPAKYYMMMFLWFVGQRCSYSDLSKTFNVPLSRAWSAVDTVMQFFVNSARDYIRFPEMPSEKRMTAENFQEIAGFPDVIGCLVRTYVEVRAPLQEPKKSPSQNESATTTIQAICDSKGRFLDVFVDASHKVHHSEMLQASPIACKLKELCQGRYHILAEGQYDVREWLLTPFKEPISQGQTLFNQKHRNTLEGVSDSLEVLRKRFQQLNSMASFSPCKMKKMIIASCVLQNICLGEDDHLDEGDPLAICLSEVGEEAVFVAGVIPDDTHLRRIGELKRKQIMEELKKM